MRDGVCALISLPDFTGQLEEGEISFTPPIDVRVDEMDFTVGEVLVCIIISTCYGS
jgi:hypothetical protein